MSAVSTSPNDSPDDSYEIYRRELNAYCYRMLGSGSEAEDAVQETMLRAWRSSDGFEGRSSVRSWLYRIASNVCIDMHRSPQRRAIAMEMGPAVLVSNASLGPPLNESVWVQPVSDDKVIDLTADPADVATARGSIRLAFVAALQCLPPRQRAVLILCEVLHWQASEVAELLDTSIAAVNSALQRARVTMSGSYGQNSQLQSVDSDEHRDLLHKYVDAFSRYDMDSLVQLLHDDAVLSMPPYNLWLRGPTEIASWMLGPGIGCKDGKLVAIHANGTAAFGNYRLTRPGVWEPFAIQLVEVTDGRISGHHNYIFPDLFAEFGLPPRIEETITTG